jgi:hypothetical protein
MKAFTTFYDEVVPEIPGADLTLVLHHIKRVCIDFCQRSLFARDSLAAIDVVASTASYAIAPTDAVNFAINKVLEVRLNSGVGTRANRLSPRTPSQLDNELPDWDTATGQPMFFTQRDAGILTLAKVPSTSITGGLLVTISKIPLYAGAGVDDATASWAESIGAGAKARLMRMPKKPWSNPALAERYERYYDQELAAATVIAEKAYGAAPLRTRSYG